MSTAFLHTMHCLSPVSVGQLESNRSLWEFRTLIFGIMALIHTKNNSVTPRTSKSAQQRLGSSFPWGPAQMRSLQVSVGVEWSSWHICMNSNQKKQRVLTVGSDSVNPQNNNTERVWSDGINFPRRAASEIQCLQVDAGVNWGSLNVEWTTATTPTQLSFLALILSLPKHQTQHSTSGNRSYLHF